MILSSIRLGDKTYLLAFANRDTALLQLSGTLFVETGWGALTARMGGMGHGPAALLLPARWRASAPAFRREAQCLIWAGRILGAGTSADICC